MMLIATTTAAALFASVAVAAAAPAAVSTPAIPPMIVNVNASPDLSASLLSRVLAETDAIWRPAGVTFVWKRTTSRVRHAKSCRTRAPAKPDRTCRPRFD